MIFIIIILFLSEKLGLHVLENVLLNFTDIKSEIYEFIRKKVLIELVDCISLSYYTSIFITKYLAE